MAKDKTKSKTPIKAEPSSATPIVKVKKEKAAQKTPKVSTTFAPPPPPVQSAFKIIRTKLYLNLAPVYVGNERKGVEEYLNRFLMRYVPEVDGVLLSYNNIIAADPVARIMYDSPFFHFHIIVTLILFAPQEKSNLVGVVNKVSPDHIGLLVHGVFNASIPADQIRKNEFYWDEDATCWKRPARESDPETDVGPGSVVKFTVAELIKANDMLTISGSLLPDPHNTGIILNPLTPPPTLQTQPDYDPESFPNLSAPITTESDITMEEATPTSPESSPESESEELPTTTTSPPKSTSTKRKQPDIPDEGTLYAEKGSMNETPASEPKMKKRKVKSEEEDMDGDNVLGAIPIVKKG
ncbi:hypothetical protein HK097_007050, partial [Rhizophlyctis rosea]